MLKSSSHPVFFLQFTCWSSILAMCAQQYYYLLLHLTVTWREKPASHTGNSNNKASKTPIFTPAIRDFTYHRSFFIESTLIKPYRLGFSVQFSHLVMSDSLWPHELQHIRPPCPSPTPGVHPTPCPLSRWCHPTISSSVIHFSSCPQSFPASGSFPMSQLFAWGGQSTGVSALASVLPKNTQDWSLLEWTGCISLQSKELSRVFSNTTVQKHQFFSAQPSSQSNSHIHTWPQEKP